MTATLDPQTTGPAPEAACPVCYPAGATLSDRFAARERPHFYTPDPDALMARIPRGAGLPRGMGRNYQARAHLPGGAVALFGITDFSRDSARASAARLTGILAGRLSVFRHPRNKPGRGQP